MSIMADLSARRVVWRGVALCLMLAAGVSLWAAQVPITGAVIAPGEVDAAPQRYSIQHRDGGVVAEVLVAEGQAVPAGALLLRLEARAVETELALVEAQAAEAEAREARLTAERDGAPFAPLPPDPSGPPERLALWADQARLFEARRAALARDRAQLVERRRQADAELSGAGHQTALVAQEVALLNAERTRLQTLRDQGLAPESRVMDLAREASRLASIQAGEVAREGELLGRIAEVDLQIEALADRHRREAAELRTDTAMRRLELAARAALLRDRLAGLVLRAPVAGVVHGLAATLPDTVLRPGTEVMQILAPAPVPLLVAHVRPDDIDHVHVGQPAMLRFPALSARNLPDLEGRVAAISAAPFADDRSGAHYFRVELGLDDAALAVLAERPLPPGLALEAFIATGERTALAYLVAPLADHWRRALRER